jgi:hypothetical protein
MKARARHAFFYIEKIRVIILMVYIFLKGIE